MRINSTLGAVVRHTFRWVRVFTWPDTIGLIVRMLDGLRGPKTLESVTAASMSVLRSVVIRDEHSASCHWSIDMCQMELLFAALSKSRFRSRFHLGPADQRYMTRKGLAAVIGHARDFVRHRLAPAHPMNDGRQTPLRGHPVFIAQHATATCCRSCLRKWHGIPTGIALTDEQVDYAVAVIMLWFEKQINRRVSADSFNDRLFSE